MKKIYSFFLVALFALSSPFALAEELEYTPIQSEYLSPKVSNASVYSSEEEMGIVLVGKIEEKEPALKLGKISTLYSDEDTRVNIEEVSTEEKARGLGVATVLYEYVIKSKESYTEKKVTHLAGTSKVGTNREVILNSLIKSLRDKTGFVEPKADAGVQEQFKQCCALIYSAYPELILQAAEQSPTAKIGKKLGFKIAPESMEFSIGELDGKTDIHINYVQVRD